MSDDVHLRLQSAQESKGRRRPSMFDDSDQEDDEPERKFRFNARQTFLTYAQCDVPGREFLHLFPLAHSVKVCFAKQERHEDGSLHLHAFCAFTRKLDLSNPQCFDLLVEDKSANAGDEQGARNVRRFHPNIKRVGGPEDLVRAWEYLCKDGVTPLELRGKVNLYKFSKNFCNVYRDRVSWLNFLRGQSQGPPVWPIIGPNGHVFEDPATAGKKRNAWIWGPPDAGKTAWLEEKVYCFANYKVGSNTYPFDQYTDQQIMLLATALERVFILKDNGQEIKLPDPEPKWSVEAVMNFYANTYPILTTAKVSAPQIKDDKVQYVCIS